MKFLQLIRLSQRKFISITKRILKILNLSITTYSNMHFLQNIAKSQNGIYDTEFLNRLILAGSDKVTKCLKGSKSQFKQDLFVLLELEFKTNGFFVEFGATNGIDGSNTFLLEKEFQWSGILAEPAKIWQSELRANRSALIEDKCVWKDSGTKLQFNETDSPGLSTISSFNNSDRYGKVRKNGKSYEVDTISLNDLLVKYNAPLEIDYLSIDTEGSEFEILAAMDFGKFNIKVITCEHNFTPSRYNVFNLLTQHGYTRKYKNLSLVDDWYVKL